MKLPAIDNNTPSKRKIVSEPEINIDEECPFESDCHFETIHESQMRYHLKKHELGQKQIEQMGRVHERRVKSGSMSKEQAWACGMADRYFYLTIDMADFERADIFVKDVFDKLDIEQKLIFVKYLGGRLITVGQQIDALVRQPMVRLF